MPGPEAAADVVVVGAGIAGLVAAQELADAGRSVVVLDKGRGVGGRLATRRIGPAGDQQARVDHGAQFFTVRTERFGDAVQRWTDLGLVHVWTRGFDAEPDGHPRHAVTGGMTALAKFLAGRVDDAGGRIVTGCVVSSVTAGGVVTADDGRRWSAGHVVLTSPVPQSIALVGDAAPAALHSIRYDPTLCLLGVLDRPAGGLGPAGAVQRPTGTPFEFIADNAARGTSPVPALTAHLTGEESARRWDRPDDEIAEFALDAAGPFLGRARLSDVQVKRWRYSTPTVGHPEPVLVDGRLAYAGDAFGPARVEGAATSGWAAADALLGPDGRAATSAAPGARR